MKIGQSFRLAIKSLLTMLGIIIGVAAVIVIVSLGNGMQQYMNSQFEQIEAIKDDVSYYLNLSDILFFETDSKIVMAHTTKNAYQVKYKLYELEDILGGNFMRVAKSTILNLDKIYAITRSISNCQIKFEESYKTVYVSRHYYRDLRNRLEERRNFQ